MSILMEVVAEQWEYRELLVRMTARDLLLRYKQTVMGFGWAIFMPLVNTAIFSVIFTRVAADRRRDAVSGLRLLRPGRLELLRLVAALLGHFAHQQPEPGHQGLLPARDLPVLRGAGLDRRLRGVGRSCSWR